MSERIKFVGRLLEGERMSDLCREFGISRKTGYKIFHRYEHYGVEGLKSRSSRSKTHPNETPEPIRRAILATRREHPTWGAPKIKVVLERRFPKWSVPAPSTIHAILDKADLVKRRRRRSGFKSEGTALTIPSAANDLWCTDFKGQFKLKNGRYCYPLTITDQYSRFLIGCEALETTEEAECIRVFTEVFEEFGLPSAIRSDNGVPFGSRSYFGLSKLSVTWLRLGIRLERIEPGHPEQNGAHERMHRTLKAECTKPPGANLLAQQEQQDAFRDLFNHERPHQGLQMQCPADLYRKSTRLFNPIMEPLEYPDHDQTIPVTNCGSLYLNNRKRLYVGTVFGGENLGIKKIEEDVWRLTFMHYDLGFFDMNNPVIQISNNPFLLKPE